jgi:hypothetical protein
MLWHCYMFRKYLNCVLDLLDDGVTFFTVSVSGHCSLSLFLI